MLLVERGEGGESWQEPVVGKPWVPQQELSLELRASCGHMNAVSGSLRGVLISANISDLSVVCRKSAGCRSRL